MKNITVQEFIDTLNNSFFCSVNVNKNILFNKIFKESFHVSIKEYGEIDNLKDYITFEQMYDGNKVDTDVRLSLENLYCIENSSDGCFQVNYNDGYIVTVFC